MESGRSKIHALQIEAFKNFVKLLQSPKTRTRLRGGSMLYGLSERLAALEQRYTKPKLSPTEVRILTNYLWMCDLERARKQGKITDDDFERFLKVITSNGDQRRSESARNDSAPSGTNSRKEL